MNEKKELIQAKINEIIQEVLRHKEKWLSMSVQYSYVTVHQMVRAPDSDEPELEAPPLPRNSVGLVPTIETKFRKFEDIISDLDICIDWVKTRH